MAVSDRVLGNLSSADSERLLRSSEVVANMPLFERQSLARSLSERRAALLAAVCSLPWFEHCWATDEPYPPAADTSPMRPCDCERCRRGNRYWPAHYAPTPSQAAAASMSMVVADDGFARSPGSRGAPILAFECYLESLDEWTAAQMPSSPSGIALRAIREGRIRLRFPRTRFKGRH